MFLLLVPCRRACSLKPTGLHLVALTVRGIPTAKATRSFPNLQRQWTVCAKSMLRPLLLLLSLLAASVSPLPQ